MFKLEFETDNAAFENREEETGRILQEIAESIEGGSKHGSINDSNGNRIGQYWSV